MSQPPTNSPLTNNCGMVGHCENSLMPSRSSAELSTSTVSYSGTSSSKICTTCAEKPHCGARRVPFMNRTTGFCATSPEIRLRRASLIMGVADRVAHSGPILVLLGHFRPELERRRQLLSFGCQRTQRSRVLSGGRGGRRPVSPVLSLTCVRPRSSTRFVTPEGCDLLLLKN